MSIAFPNITSFAEVEAMPVASDNGYTPLTMAMWGKLLEKRAGVACIIWGGADAHYLNVTAANLVRAATGAASLAQTSVSPIAAQGEWQLFVGKWASEASRIARVDTADSPANTTSLTPAGLDTITIGNSQSGANDGFPGLLSRIAIYNGEITEADLVRLYRREVGATELANLVAYFPGTLTPLGLLEETVSGNHATLGGGAEYSEDEPGIRRAGRSRRKLVEIDGQFIEVFTDDEAARLLRKPALEVVVQPTSPVEMQRTTIQMPRQERRLFGLSSDTGIRRLARRS